MRIRQRTRQIVQVLNAAVLMAAALLLAVQMPGQAPMGTKPMPMVGGKAADFSLGSIDGMQVQLSKELEGHAVVLVVLRGWPGYQCPFCTRQFGEYLKRAGEFERSGARVLFVYPGPAEGIQDHAAAFTANQKMPMHFRLLLDPDYKFTEAYGLRWDAPKETAYPSTFVVDRNGIVRFTRVSREHGGRVPADEVLKALSGLMQ